MENATRNAPRKLATIQADIAALEGRIKWGHGHPFAGVCGEDDARADRLAELRAELAESLRADGRQTRSFNPNGPTWNRRGPTWSRP